MSERDDDPEMVAPMPLGPVVSNDLGKPPKEVIPPTIPDIGCIWAEAAVFVRLCCSACSACSRSISGFPNEPVGPIPVPGPVLIVAAPVAAPPASPPIPFVLFIPGIPLPIPPDVSPGVIIALCIPVAIPIEPPGLGRVDKMNAIWSRICLFCFSRDMFIWANCVAFSCSCSRSIFFRSRLIFALRLLAARRSSFRSSSDRKGF